MRILAIDPGSTESGVVIVDTQTYRPVYHEKLLNDEVRRLIFAGEYDEAVVEMVASYGMAVGAEVFQTCVWIGRFYAEIQAQNVMAPTLIMRQPIKLHLCHSPKANDSNVRQALVDRFAEGQPNHGKGTKANPGWFYGFKADVWAAYALSVYAADKVNGAIL